MKQIELTREILKENPNLKELLLNNPDQFWLYFNKIGQYGLSNNSQIKEVTLPAHIQQIGYAGFANCENLEKVDIRNIKYLGAHAFFNCKKLKEITLPEGLTYNAGINSPFTKCYNLEKINIVSKDGKVVNSIKLKDVDEKNF